MTNEQLAHIFSYHAPTEEQIPKYESVNKAFLELAIKVDSLMPDGPGKLVAIRKLNEARNSVNSAIALKGRF